ncbi:hypothetical protein DTW90_27220 [Neorhizobium sp. P12A]|uniref:hypothetical protein n=1 Tax=Rhizobium/Agrobacterium group TaxID=227290 RepID=UPI00104EE597|nr:MULTISPECIES: hypothetical protein [Rhizobium/Agrobacterium group]KAA0692631.1 hypothetical protein DTW90_27220 [Neorhizobium sp. P12A]TCR82365.1 hypothetical protein EV561_11028 [Rhizobium sp. BK376]
MANDFNRPDLKSTPVHDQSWRMWGVIAAVIVIAAVAWSMWPRTATPPVSPPAQTTTNQPATTTAPATPPAAPATPAPATPAPAAPAQ